VAIRALTSLLVAVLLASSRLALACGGPWQADLRVAIAPRVDEAFCQLVSLDDIDHRVATGDHFVFLYPAVATAGDALTDLWLAAYEKEWGRDIADGSEPPKYRLAPQPGVFEAAVAARDWAQAKRVATAEVQQILDMPAPQADLHRVTFNRALEFLELAPFVSAIGDGPMQAFLSSGAVDDGSTVLVQAKAVRGMARDDATRLLEADPHQARAATLRFVVLTRALQQGIPNGWRGNPPLADETYKRLQALVDTWLAEFPSHPLADLVRLMKARLDYFHDDLEASFDVVLDVHARHPARALFELRYLVMQGYYPELATLMARRVPPEVLTGFVPAYLRSSTPDDWASLWALAAAHPGAAWATNLQERLLFAIGHSGDPLPAWFPSEARAPSELWGQLRLYLLVRHQRWDDAERQLAVLKPDPTLAPFVGAIRLARGDTWGAIRSGLPEDVRTYVIRVLLRDDELEKLAHTGDDWERAQAADALGVRRGFAGDWRAAAALVRAAQPERAQLWEQCGTLAADKSPAGLLRWARFLVEHRGQIFHPVSGEWYASFNTGWAWSKTMPSRPCGPDAPLRPDWSEAYEVGAISRFLLRNERLVALDQYVAYLEREKDPRARATALAEADDDYNHLVNFTVVHPHFWEEVASNGKAVRRLREIGRDVRRSTKR
jgi:hypothetical protein